MRLLNTYDLRFEEFFGNSIPEYAILSHMWEEEEVSFQDMQSGNASNKKGYLKIASCCERATRDGYKYFWIDTCCIDKSSSAELSEAINSMYQWYKNSNICYAYLSDVKYESRKEDFEESRWFRRGWTLQELIAPAIVEFYGVDWVEIGTKLSLQKEISQITGISENILRGEDPSGCTVATRLSWAAQRTTTREEDEAYCLMGLFNVNFSLLYGEGGRAFRRLQEEILRVTDDYTLLIWAPVMSLSINPLSSAGLLAPSASAFTNCIAQGHDLSNIRVNYSRLSKTPLIISPPKQNESISLSLTSRGLRVTLPIKSCVEEREILACLSVFKASLWDAYEHLLCVKLISVPGQDRYIRPVGESLRLLSTKSGKDFASKTIYIEQPQQVMELDSDIEGIYTYTKLAVVDITSTEPGDPITITNAAIYNLQQVLLDKGNTSRSLSDSPAPNPQITSNPQRLTDTRPIDIHALAELCQAGPGGLKSAYLVEQSWQAKSIDFMIQGLTASSFQIVLGTHVKAPHLRAYLTNPTGWRYTSKTELASLPVQEPDFNTRNLQHLPITDRLVFCMRFLSCRENHKFVAKLRRVCSLFAQSSVQKYILKMNHQKVSWDHIAEERDVIYIEYSETSSSKLGR